MKDYPLDAKEQDLSFIENSVASMEIRIDYHVVQELAQRVKLELGLKD